MMLSAYLGNHVIKRRAVWGSTLRGERQADCSSCILVRAGTFYLAGMSKVKILVKFNQTDQVIIEM